MYAVATALGSARCAWYARCAGSKMGFARCAWYARCAGSAMVFLRDAHWYAAQCAGSGWVLRDARVVCAVRRVRVSFARCAWYAQCAGSELVLRSAHSSINYDTRRGEKACARAMKCVSGSRCAARAGGAVLRACGVGCVGCGGVRARAGGLHPWPHLAFDHVAHATWPGACCC